ncbi:MAG: PspC domain-containing protein [Terracidiphilus sp.]|jgi:phage shock protein C
MAVFCNRCGTGLPARARFCSSCGATIPMAQPMPGRPLIRPRTGRQIAGVCLALAQSNGWDVSVVRILAVLGFFFSSGLVGVAYVAAWIGIPEETPNLPGAYPPGI